MAIQALVVMFSGGRAHNGNSSLAHSSLNQGRVSSMRTILFILVVALVVPAVSLGQDMELIKPGPLGRPSLVRGEGEGGGNWEAPISVYSNPDIELFVSENLTPVGNNRKNPGLKADL